MVCTTALGFSSRDEHFSWLTSQDTARAGKHLPPCPLSIAPQRSASQQLTPKPQGLFLRTDSWMLSHRSDALHRLSFQPLVPPSRPAGTCGGVGAFPRLPRPFPGRSSPAGSGAASCTLPHVPVGSCDTPCTPNPWSSIARGGS